MDLSPRAPEIQPDSIDAGVGFPKSTQPMRPGLPLELRRVRHMITRLG